MNWGLEIDGQHWEFYDRNSQEDYYQVMEWILNDDHCSWMVEVTLHEGCQASVRTFLLRHSNGMRIPVYKGEVITKAGEMRFQDMFNAIRF